MWGTGNLEGQKNVVVKKCGGSVGVRNVREKCGGKMGGKCGGGK